MSNLAKALMASPQRAAAPVSPGPTSLDAAAAPVLLDGDLPVSLEEWRHAIKPHQRRARMFQLLVVWLPIVLFIAGALEMFRQLMVKVQAVFVVMLEQRLPRIAGPGADRVLAAFDLAEELARAHWWSLALTSAAVLSLGAVLISLLALLNRLLLIVNPRTRADLRVTQRLIRAQFRTVLPALWTAGGIYILWILWIAFTDLRESTAELGIDRYIHSSVVLVLGLVLLAVCGNVALIVTSSRRREIPREHLLRWLGRNCSSLLVTGLLLPAILHCFGFVLPRQVVPAIDRLVLSRLDARVLAVARSHGLAGAKEIQRMVRTLPTRSELAKAPMCDEMLRRIPLGRFVHAIAVLWLAAVTFHQPLLGWLARGSSRWVWSAATMIGGGLLLAIGTGRAEPVLGGAAGSGWITVYVTLSCAGMTADVLLTPANSPRRTAGGPAEIALARVQLQEGEGAGEERVERARRIYARVGCALDASPGDHG